jgi:hypothetical protein
MERVVAEPLSEEQLERLAEINPEDVERAKLQWKKDAPREMRDLLDAEPMDG